MTCYPSSLLSETSRTGHVRRTTLLQATIGLIGCAALYYGPSGLEFVVIVESQTAQVMRRPILQYARRNYRGVGMHAVEECQGEPFIDDAIEATSRGPPHVLVLSFSTTWCGPCKLMDPKVKDLSDKYVETARFIKIMGDKDPDGVELMKREGVRSVPQYHIYKDGQRVDSIQGAKYDDLVASLGEHVGS